MDYREITEAQLVVALHELVPGDEYEDLRSKLSQQMVNYILKGGAERSFYTPFLADALSVPCVWLAFGIGHMPLSDERPVVIEARTDRERKLLQAFRYAEDPIKRVIEKALKHDTKTRPKKQAASKKTDRAA